MGAQQARRHATRFVATGVIFALAGPAVASEMGEQAVARVSQANYQHYLDDMLYTHLGDNRGFGLEHDLARDNIASLLESFGLTVTLEPFDYWGTTYYNVVGTKLGTTYPDQEYIIGAHYDSVNNPGADDNASGTTLMLESARVLHVYESEYTIRFIAFDREEQGLIGSEAYVDDHIDDDILGMISADMVAYNVGTNSVDIYGRTTSEPIKTALAEAVATYGDGLGYSVYGPSGGSDQASFERAGFVACEFIEDWGNPYYHTQQDSVDTPNYIDYGFAYRGTRSVVGYLVDNAGVQVPPCGDGIVETGEFCDTAIAPGEPGACPTECGTGDPCNLETLLEPGTCLARCDVVTITDPAHDDGCCPPGANAINDNDCDPVCGNGVCEEGETTPGCPADCQCSDDSECNDNYLCTLDQCVGDMCMYTPSPYDYGDVDRNGAINVFDLFCVLNGFGGDFSVCALEDDDIHPCAGNDTVNIFDLFAVLNAFGGADPCCGG